MNSLQLRRLREFCDKHGLDYQEIDDTLTYSEAKTHLKSLVTETDMREQMDYWASQEEAFFSNHFLWYYIHCIKEGKTKSASTGIVEPESESFSLKQLALNTVCKA